MAAASAAGASSSVNIEIGGGALNSNAESGLPTSSTASDSGTGSQLGSASDSTAKGKLQARGAQPEASEVRRSVSLVNNAPNDYVATDLCLYTSPDLRALAVGSTGRTIDFFIDNGTTNLGTWNTQTADTGLGEGVAPATTGLSTDVLTFSSTVGASDSNVSPLAVQSVNLGGGAIGNDFYSGAIAGQADGAIPHAFDIQMLGDLSSGGSDDGHAMSQIVHFVPGTSLAFSTVFGSAQGLANDIFATDAANVQGAVR